ncbi:hypothetical protein IWW36_003992 [Coemansia brasiliensis]|uniref:Uncharacterized protein n=1 Tax=Coemansia brasiliensis TaxID=2650707 RepID=A0A9W8LYE9_9FUNG|nr:hypothetical protein IWW36_003992 [Coemansia brasiliensis]
MVLGWQRAPRRSREQVVSPPSVPSAIAEDEEVVPQFFPGYQPRMAAASNAASAAAAQEQIQQKHKDAVPQRRAGSIRLSINPNVRSVEAHLGDQQRSSAHPSPHELRRTSCTSTASSATVMSLPCADGMARSSSCYYPARCQMQRPPPPHDFSYKTEQMPFKPRRASAVVVKSQKEAPQQSEGSLPPPQAAVANEAADALQPDTCEPRQTDSKAVSRSNSSSSTSTLGNTAAAASPLTKRTALPKHITSLLYRSHHGHQRLRKALRRNHTTKTVSNNDLLADELDKQQRWQSMRSASFAEMADYAQSTPLRASMMRYSIDVSSPDTPSTFVGDDEAQDGLESVGVAENVNIGMDGNDDVKIAAWLVPRTRSSSKVQMAYLPPRTSILKVANVLPQDHATS